MRQQRKKKRWERYGEMAMISREKAMCVRKKVRLMDLKRGGNEEDKKAVR